MKQHIPIFTRLAICALAISLFLTSCKKKKDEVDPEPDLTTEKDLSNANADFNSILDDIDRAASNVDVNQRLEGVEGYFTFTLSALKDTAIGTFDKYLLLTYVGNGLDGLDRSGSILLFFKAGHSRADGNYEDSAVFKGTRVDGRSITGTKHTKQVAADNANAWKFQIKANGTIANESGTMMNYTSSRTRVRTGINTPSLYADDMWNISGSWEGTNASGESVSATIGVPLILKASCNARRPVAGTIDFTNHAKGITRSINYGDGECDNMAAFTNAKGKVFQIIVR